MTECCGKISMSMLSPQIRAAPYDVQLEAMCSSGRPFCLMDVKVLDASGNPVPTWDSTPQNDSSVNYNIKDTDDTDAQKAAAVGEVWVKGPTLCAGYWRRPDANADAFSQDGWFSTGDLATVRSDGYICLVDRKKDMILCGGENVYTVGWNESLG